MGRRVIAYIDGFNFYYGQLIDKPHYKWLDLYKFCSLLMAGDNLLKVKYFTALSFKNGDSQRPVRQETYWRALKKTNEEKIEIIKGSFRIDPKRYKIAEFQFEKYPDGSQPKNTATRNNIYIMKPEEKGSDVNLAVHLLNDAWKNEYDTALVVSNDSDLAESIRIVKHQCMKKVALANPFQHSRHGVAKGLKDIDVENRTIRKHQLESSQMPDEIPGTKIHKPCSWH